MCRANFARTLPSSTRVSSWLERTFTMANSDATKKAFRITRAKITASFPRIIEGGSQCSETASANGAAAIKTRAKEFMEWMRRPHPKTRWSGSLPARLGHTRDEPARGKLSERQARNLEAANEGAATAADLATIDHPGRAGIAWKLRESHVVFLRFELS